jgi:hypothetical protein
MLAKGIIPKSNLPAMDPQAVHGVSFPIPLPDIPLPIPSFSSTILALVAALPL